MNKKRLLEISSGTARIAFELSNELADQIKNSRFLHEYIPDVLVSKNSESGIVIHVRDIDTDRISVELNNNKGLIQLNLEKVSVPDFITLIDYILEYFRQLNGIYCVHGSAISYDGKGIWFMGPVSGLGKTTISLNLCLNRSFNFIGDEKILIDSSFNILGGVKNVIYNKDFLKKSVNRDLDGKSEDELGSVLNIEYYAVPFKLGLVPIIFQNSRYPEIDKWNEEKIDFHVYEELSRKIRGVSRRICNFTLPVQSLDTPQLAYKRSIFAKKVAKSIPFYIFKGGEDQIYRFLMTKLGYARVKSNKERNLTPVKIKSRTKRWL